MLSDACLTQLSCPLASVTAAVITAGVGWPAPGDPPTEVEIRKEIQALGCHKASGFDGIFPAPFHDKRMELIKEL